MSNLRDRDLLYARLREVLGIEPAEILMSNLAPPSDIATRADIHRLETRMDGLETRMDGLETRMDGLETRMGRLEAHMERFDGRLHDFHGHCASRPGPSLSRVSEAQQRSRAR